MSEYIASVVNLDLKDGSTVGKVTRLNDPLEEIVRCRDCVGKDYCEAYQDYKNPNGFCAWCERKVDA